jgi:hypothetical protein
VRRALGSPRLAPFRAAALAAVLSAPSLAFAEPAPVAPRPAAAAVLVAPKLLSDPVVAYPQGATGEARVVLALTINADGTVRQATASAPNEPFSSQAAGAALGWKFAPATRNGAPVPSKILFEVVFHAPAAPVEEPSPGSIADVPASAAGGAAHGPARERPTPAGAEGRPADARGAAAHAAEEPIEIVIRGARPEPSRTVTLSRAEVREIPGTFGDPFRAVEIMPGVTPIISGLPYFFVRGAPPGDVGYFVDGIRVPQLFHVGVGPSVIHPGLVERVDLYPGGYPARFGRFAGGIVAGETTEPVKRLHGEYNLRLFDAGAMAEAPFANERGSVLLGGRYSYTAALLTLVSADTVVDYWDYQARATYEPSDRDRVGVFAFGSYDYLGRVTPTETLTMFGTQFHRVDLRYDRRLAADGTLRWAVTGGLDRSQLLGDRVLRDRIVGTRAEVAWRLAPGALLRAGTDLQVDTYDMEVDATDLGPSAVRASQLFPSRTDVAIGARADIVLAVRPGFEVTPGARLDMFGSQGQGAAAVDPRLGLRTRMSERAWLVSAMGLASQPPAFVVPLPGFQPGGLRGGLQHSVQESLGVEIDLGEGTIATATGFHNAFFNMSDPLGSMQREVGGCPPGSFPADSLAGDRGAQPGGGSTACGPRFAPGTLGPDRSGGGGAAADSARTSQVTRAFETRTMGTSYGIELMLKRKLTSRLGGFVSYTLSRSTRSVGNRTFVASFDRTHVANAAIAYNLGRAWRAGTRVVFYTGLPKAPDPTDPEATRLPAFFRLDLRLEKRWQLGERTWISAVAECMNATLSKEAVSTTCTLQGCETQTIGPVTIPSLGVEGGF